MKVFTVRERLFASSALFGAAMLSAFANPALAQAPDAPVAPNTPPSAPAFGPAAADLSTTNANGDKSNSVKEVVVTGSRIRAPGLTSTSPLTVVTQQAFKDIGATSVEQLLNELPAVVASQNSGLSGLSNGTSTVDLRDLNPKRTLVLVNGRRLMPGDPAGTGPGPVPDINIIPVTLIDRVDVVTGGASAVYGSDAVAGVVNFIMKKDFQGVRIDVTENFANHDNNNAVQRGLVADSGFVEAPAGNQTYQLGVNVTGVIGLNAPDGKGNVTGYVGYRNLQPILQSKYDVSACTISAAPGAVSTIYSQHTCGGSSNGLYGKFVPTTTSTALGGSAKTLHANPDGSQTFVTSSVPAFNYGATNYFQRSETRYTGGYFANYEVTPMLDIYSEFMFDDDKTVGQIAPSGLFAGGGANGASTYNINCNNPLLAASQQAQLCGTAAGTATQVPYLVGYRFGSFPRDYGFEHLDYKINIGARGQLDEAWGYDAYLQYGTSILSNLLQNEASTTRIQNALLVDPATGQCYVGGACAPLNVFKLNGVTPAAFNYASADAFQEGQTTEQVASAVLNGDLGHYGIRSPYATDGVGVALGGEYRREFLTFSPDQEYQTSDLSGSSPALPSQGSYDVYELFGEVRVPIVQNLPFVKELSFDGGYRFSDYNTSGITDTYKGQAEYAPTPDIRFRGGYNRAVRTPNVVELFKPQTQGLFSGTDPCVGNAPAASLAACVATGLPAAMYGKLSNDLACPAGQCTVLQGGNVNLAPEKADTYTGGFVLTPTMAWARGFTLSVDYFNITVRNVITEISPTIFTTECAAGDLAICSSTFKRDPATYVIFGTQGYIRSLNTNSGFLRTDGVDLDSSYRKRLSDFGLPDLGIVSFNLLMTYTNSYRDQPVSGGATYNCAGLYGTTCGNPLPKIKGQFRATYTPPRFPISVSAAWRYVGPVHLDEDRKQPLLIAHPYGATDTADNGLHSFSYFDMSASVKVRDGLTFNFGCQNLLDKDPPVVDSGPFAGSGQSAGNGNTYPGIYDYLGRRIFAELTADF